MEGPRDLNEYRNERIESIKSAVLDVVNDHLLSRTDGDFSATFGRMSVAELELFVMNDEFDSGFHSAAEFILNEIAIDIANALHKRDDLPYTVDMSEITGEAPHIRIVKM